MSNEPEDGASADEKALEWLDDLVRHGRGAVMFAMTENGDIGLFLDDTEASKSIGGGDTCMEAIIAACSRESSNG